jgi:stage II sporulation protein M
MIKKRSVVKDSYWNKLNNFVNENFSLGFKHLKEIKNYVYFSFAVFLIFGVIGFIFPIFFVDQVIALIQELIKQTEGLGVIGLARFIIANNVQSAFFGMIFGIILGIFPLIVIVVNGYILGFVANQVTVSEGGLVLWRLLPHGIFEIPAIMIAVGVGLRLGMFLFISKKKTWVEFRKWVLNALRVFILIVIPLLVIAGIIEGLLITFLG